jgi:hypothetical protein
MGMLSKEELQTVVPQQEVKPIRFATNSEIDKVLAEMDEVKQPFDKPDIPEDPLTFETEEPEISQAQKRRSNQTAEFIVSTVDKALSVGFATWAKSENSKEFEADPEDIDELAQYWGVYFQGKDIDLPPWVMALVVTAIVLSKKFNHASIVRKHNLELEAERAEKKALKEENERLNREKETEDLRKENEKLKGKQNEPYS